MFCFWPTTPYAHPNRRWWSAYLVFWKKAKPEKQTDRQTDRQTDLSLIDIDTPKSHEFMEDLTSLSGWEKYLLTPVAFLELLAICSWLFRLTFASSDYPATSRSERKSIYELLDIYPLSHWSHLRGFGSPGIWRVRNASAISSVSGSCACGGSSFARFHSIL